MMMSTPSTAPPSYAVATATTCMAPPATIARYHADFTSVTSTHSRSASIASTASSAPSHGHSAGSTPPRHYAHDPYATQLVEASGRSDGEWAAAEATPWGVIASKSSSLCSNPGSNPSMLTSPASGPSGATSPAPPPPPPYEMHAAALPPPQAAAVAVVPLGASSPVATASSPQRKQHSPYAYTSPVAAGAAAIRKGVAHQPLLADCTYTEVPPIPAPEAATTVDNSATPVAPATAPHPLYIGQVRFETTPGQIRWLVHKMTSGKALPVRADALHNGWFVAWFKRPEDVNLAANALHNNILFDIKGFFTFAGKDGAREHVEMYMRSREFRQRAQRLPRGLVHCARKLPPQATAPAAGNSGSQQQQQSNGRC